ncbi:hypothetical protein BH739_04700 [Enterococcus casseliflavus]|nr:hypothetical protein BH739_04700 [Enterococcus casseliflavus]
MLTSNEHFLLERLLLEEEFQTYETLSEELQVSIRSIRNLLVKLAPFFEENNLVVEKRYGFGIRLVSDVIDSKQALLKTMATSLIYRREVMKLILLFHFRKQLSINKLCDCLFLTKNAVISDLDSIERELEMYNLKLSKTHQGTTIRGHRKDIKAAIIDSVHKYGTEIIFDHQQLLSDNQLMTTKVLVPSFEETVQSLIKAMEQQYAYRFNRDFSKTLVIHLIVDILLFGESGQCQKCEESLAMSFQKQLEQALVFVFNQAYNPERIAEYLEVFSENEQPITQHSLDVAQQLLRTFEQIRQISFEKFEEIQELVAMQIEHVRKRHEYRISVFHPFLKQMMDAQGADFLALKLSTYTLKDCLPKFSDDELSFLLIYLLNMEHIDKKDLTVVVQTDYSLSSQKYLKQTFAEQFPFCQIELSSESITHSVDKQLQFEPNQPLQMQGNEMVSLDIFNASHVAVLKKEMLQLRNQKTLQTLNAQFERKTIPLIALKKRKKETVIQAICEYLLGKQLVEMKALRMSVEEDQKNPIFWFKHKSALLIFEGRAGSHQLLRFKLPFSLSWRENNERSNVEQVYVYLGEKPTSDEMSVVFKEIQFTRWLSN